MSRIFRAKFIGVWEQHFKEVLTNFNQFSEVLSLCQVHRYD